MSNPSISLKEVLVLTKRKQVKHRYIIKKAQHIRLFLITSFMVTGLLFLVIFKLYAYSNDKMVRIVTRDEILKAMQMHRGYDPTATTNVARFQAEVLLQLARQARELDPKGPRILIKHDDWFWAFLDINELSLEEAPTFALLAYQHKQDQLVDYCSDHVIKKIEKGAVPELAVNVKVSWPKTSELPSKYSFKDTLSTPNLKVTNHRLITYRLLDFGEMIVYDDIRGLTGRPTTGILSLLFRVIGEGRVVQSKMTISEDGLQINRAKAKKGPIKVTTTVTVRPDGHISKGIPSDRPDLLALEARLKQPIKIKYVPFNSLQL